MSNQKITDLIKTIVKKDDSIKLAKVKKKLEKLVYIVEIDGYDFEARLSTENATFLPIPKLGTYCVYYKVGNNAYIDNFSELESIEFLDNKDNLVYYSPLKEALEILEDINNSWKLIFDGWTTAVPNDGGLALWTVYQAQSSNIDIGLTKFSNLLDEMKNEKLKQ